MQSKCVCVSIGRASSSTPCAFSMDDLRGRIARIADPLVRAEDTIGGLRNIGEQRLRPSCEISLPRGRFRDTVVGRVPAVSSHRVTAVGRSETSGPSCAGTLETDGDRLNPPHTRPMISRNSGCWLRMHADIRNYTPSAEPRPSRAA